MINLRNILLVLISTFSIVAYGQQKSKARVLVLIHSDNGGTYELAKEFVKGLESSNQAEAIIKLVKKMTMQN